MDQQTKKKRVELEKLIGKAIEKVHGEKENDLCKYIPGPSGGYMHHFTMRKLKNTDPSQLFDLLQKFIVNSSTPKALEPKPRAPRGSRQRWDVVSFTRADIEKVLEFARQAGNTELLDRFSPKRTLPALKRELIRSIKANEVRTGLWNGYVEAISLLENL